MWTLQEIDYQLQIQSVENQLPLMYLSQFYLAVTTPFVKQLPPQRKEDFIGACEDALRFYSGAPMAIVPDNLKSAVNRPDKVGPIINQDFAAFAEHYGCVVMPARVRRP